MKNLVGKSINANLLEGLNTLTGKLLFNEEGFSFKADSVNSTMDMGYINYSDIQDIELVNSLAIVPNVICVKTNDKTWKFVVARRKEIAEFLITKKNNTV